MILINANPKKIVNPEMYNTIIYMGFKPERDLQENEIVIQPTVQIEKFGTNILISLHGRLNNHKLLESGNKFKLQSFYAKGIDQIILNDSKSNVEWTTDTGEKLYFVGKGNHLEFDL